MQTADSLSLRTASWRRELKHLRSRSLWVRVVIPVVAVASLVVGVFGALRIRVEYTHMRDDLDRRARALSHALVPQANRVLVAGGTAAKAPK